MDENTTKIIKEKFDSLPESIQEVILSSHYEDRLIEIGKKYQLNVEQMGILERETTLVLMGLTPTKNFESELTHQLGIDRSKGFQIVTDINEEIFLKIRELLKIMNGEEIEEPSGSETETAWSQNLRRISGKYGINETQKATLKAETDSLIRGRTNLIEYEEMLTRELGLSRSTADSMLKEIENSVLAPAGVQINKIPAGQTQLHPNDVQVLKDSGIEIVEKKETLPVPEKLELEPPEKINKEILPILAQKLSGYVQNEVKETDHSEKNISTGSDIVDKNKSSGYIQDPYRMKPE